MKCATYRCVAMAGKRVLNRLPVAYERYKNRTQRFSHAIYSFCQAQYTQASQIFWRGLISVPLSDSVTRRRSGRKSLVATRDKPGHVFLTELGTLLP